MEDFISNIQLDDTTAIAIRDINAIHVNDEKAELESLVTSKIFLGKHMIMISNNDVIFTSAPDNKTEASGGGN